MDLPSRSSYMAAMDGDAFIKDLFETTALVIAEIPKSSLLMLALAAMIASWIGGTMIRRRVPLGGMVRGASSLVLVGVLVTVVLQIARIDPRFDVAASTMGMPAQIVEGGETRVPLSPDGHYWLRAQVNGQDAAFLVDTGATLTAISSNTAQAAGISARTDRLPIQLNTANGTIQVPLATIDELRFGNVAARGLDAVIAPNIGETNVIGMNLLSRLAEWRVQDSVLILTPNNPQPAVEWEGE
ncbi:retropepsin-like aspartic protease family protein [Erythrobacter litoralis]|nr:TIGR02281 family clan AA aspartic protease [Erythrobacter litoralis]